jgi:hypothetical protein
MVCEECKLPIHNGEYCADGEFHHVHFPNCYVSNKKVWANYRLQKAQDATDGKFTELVR